MELSVTKLRVRLLGPPEFTWAHERVSPASRKGFALLALLAAHESGLRREEIAEFLWEPGKLASVRQALYELRKLPGAQEWLVEDGPALRLEADTDVASFEAAVEAGRMGDALAHHAGEFLAGLDEVPVPAFVDWLNHERQRLSALHLTTLHAHAQQLEVEGEFGAARLRVQEALEIDPLDEELYRSGMRLAYIQGDVEGAREFFKRCAAMMRLEFGEEPSRETLELAAAIERGEPLPVSADLTRLPLPHLRLLQALAVGRGALGVEETAKVVERPGFDVASDLGVLEASGLVNAHLVVRPSHLSQVLASMPMALRRLLHERTAEVLMAGDDADEAEVARHLLSAGNPAAAAPRFLRSAKEAVARSDLQEAVALLFRLLWADDGTDAGSVRLEACLMLEGLASQTGDDALQDAALEEAERLAWFRQSDVHLADVRMRRSRLELMRGQRGKALEYALEALEIGTRLEDAGLVARARNAVGGAQFYTGDLDGAAESFRANLTADQPVERFRAHNNLGALAAIRGSLNESYEHFAEALTLARVGGTRAEVASTLNNLAATAERLADYGLATRHFRDGLDLARRDGAVAIEGQLLVNLAVIYRRQGQLGPAWNTVMEVAELAQEQKDLRLLAHSYNLKSDVRRTCGQPSEAIDLQELALAKAEEAGDDRRVSVLRAELATLRCVAGLERLEVATTAIEALEAARLPDVTPWLWLELALATTDPHESRNWLERIGANVTNRHVRLLVELAQVRAALLQGEESADDRARVERLAGERQVRAENEGGGVDLVTLEVTERPYGWWLLHRWYERFVDRGAARIMELTGRTERDLVTAELEQQAAGLPRDMRESLLGGPARWGEELGSD